MATKVYTDWQQRVIEEKAELDIKIGNLNTFLESEKFEALDSDSQDLLIKQANIMDDYSRVLELRIHSF